MASESRAIARELAGRHVTAGDPLGWFEPLYEQAAGDASTIPWADLRPNPNVTSWLEHEGIEGSGRTALKIGCGLGDDAQELARVGFDTTAFDISPAAIAWCHRRFPDSPVRYVEADLLDPPAEWAHAYDLVVESYTLQVLPPELRPKAMRCAAGFVAPGGTLLLVTRGREPSDPEGAMPWPLTAAELTAIEDAGLSLVRLEDYVDGEDPPVRRFRAEYTLRSTLDDYSSDEVREALRPLASLISKSEKAREKLVPGTWQHTMLSNNVKALRLAAWLMGEEDRDATSASSVDCDDALRAFGSMIDRVEHTRAAFSPGTSQHTLQRDRLKALRIAEAAVKAESARRCP